jgi:hypothetical protein
MMESQGGTGGVVVCLGVGGLVDLGGLLGIDGEGDEGSYGRVEVWVVDARRPWNLGNVFGGVPALPQIEEDGEWISQRHPGVDGGKIQRDYKPGKGGIIVFDDGDIEEELDAERDAYLALLDMPEPEENEDDSDGDETESEDEESAPKESRPGQKRKSWSDRDEENESSGDDDRPRQRRRSNSVCLIPTTQIFAMINSTSVDSNFVSIASTQTRTYVFKWPKCCFFERFKISLSHASTSSKTSICKDIAAAIVEATQKERIHTPVILLTRCLLLGTYFLHDVLFGFRAGTRRQ